MSPPPAENDFRPGAPHRVHLGPGRPLRGIVVPTASKKPSTASDSFTPRLAALRRRMRGWQADALLVTNPPDLRYLTGFSGEDSWALVRAGRSRVTVLSDSRFTEQLEREAPQTEQITRQGPFSDAVQKLVRRYELERIGLQRDHVTLGMHRMLVRKLTARRLVSVDDGLLQQRSIKDAGEVRCIRRAVACQQAAFRQWLRYVKPGCTENDLAARLEMIMRQLGADGASFPTIVAVGANGSLPHAVPGGRKVRRGQPVLVDWGARWKGYCGDLTRVVAVGSMSRRLREVYAVVLAAQEAAIAAVAPGVALWRVDAVARDVIAKAGYGAHFGHGLGHGIGLDIHEMPSLSARGEGVLEPGQIVTIEPGIYLPGIGGVRIEDDVLVTPRGYRMISDLPTDLSSMTI